MSIPMAVVDAFTHRPFTGNPAAVCLLEEPRGSEWMQAVAAEMNLSETAFVARGDEAFGLRWFTPATEVALCGHATLASAHTLWDRGWLAEADRAVFDTRSGRLVASRHGDLVELDFPALPPAPATISDEMVGALGAAPRYVGLVGDKILMEVDSEDTVRTLVPDFQLLGRLPGRGVMVTARADAPDVDFVSRYFAPWVGIDEDPVTGSAHCSLGPYWGRVLGKTEMVAFQASARGGLVQVRLDGDRVVLGGQAVTIWRGELAV